MHCLFTYAVSFIGLFNVMGGYNDRGFFRIDQIREMLPNAIKTKHNDCSISNTLRLGSNL